MWVVYASSGDYTWEALARNYTGVSGEATVVGGVGANVLVGRRHSFSLQPVNVQSQRGLRIAGGIGSIRLDYES